MTNRERFLNVLNFKKASDRLPIMEWAPWWDQTLERWKSEGLEWEKNNGQVWNDAATEELKEKFGLDMIRLFWPRPMTDSFLASGRGRIDSVESYERAKKYLYPDDGVERIKEKVLFLKQLHEKGEAVVWLALDGFFWFPRELLGIENHLYAFHDKPELIHRINQDLAEFNIYLVEEFCEIMNPDLVSFEEDMSYNHGPMISYGMFREFMKPYYDQVIPKLKERNIIMFIDSDGFVEPLIAWFMEAGIEGILPLERMAGVDVAKIRNNYPKFKMLGGYDKTVMSQGENKMRKEFERLLPVMKKGGFIAACDHQTPPDVSLENYRIYVRLLKEYAEKAVS